MNVYKIYLLKVHRHKYYLYACYLYPEKYAWISIQLREDLEQWALEQEAAEWNPGRESMNEMNCEFVIERK